MDAQGLIDTASGNTQTLLIGIFVCMYIITQALKAVKNFRDSPADRNFEQGKSIDSLVEIIKERAEHDRAVMAEAMNKMSVAVTAMAGLDATFKLEIKKLDGTMGEMLTAHRASNEFQSKLAVTMGQALTEIEQIKLIDKNADKYRIAREERNGNLDSANDRSSG